MEDNSFSIALGATQIAKVNDKELKANAFKLFEQGLSNLKIAEELEVTYEMVVALRISYEKRNANLSCN